MNLITSVHFLIISATIVFVALLNSSLPCNKNNVWWISSWNLMTILSKFIPISLWWSSHRLFPKPTVFFFKNNVIKNLNIFLILFLIRWCLSLTVNITIHVLFFPLQTNIITVHQFLVRNAPLDIFVTIAKSVAILFIVVSKYMVTLIQPNLGSALLQLSIPLLMMITLLSNTLVLLMSNLILFFNFLANTRILC